MNKVKDAPYWTEFESASEQGTICFIDSYGWGVSPKGTNICLGKEEDIRGKK